MSRSVKTGEVVDAGISYDVMECYVGDDAEKGVKGERVEYRQPKTAVDFQKMVAATREQATIDAWERYNYGHGLKARAAGRPDTGGVALPIIGTKRYGKLNLVDGTFDGVIGEKKQPAQIKWEGKPLALANRVNMLNAYLMGKAETGASQRGADIAIAQLLAAKQVTQDKDGVLKAVPAK